MIHVKKFVHIILGSSLLMVGILGMILPIVHGVLFFLLGLILLSFESTYIEKKLLYYVQKHKKVNELYTKLDRTLRRWFNKN